MATPSKTPVLVLSLIFTMLVLSVGSIALIVLFNANRPDSATIAAACKSEVGAAIKTESAKVAKACEEAQKSQTVSMPGSRWRPGLSYPAGWSAVGKLIQREGDALTPGEEYYTVTLSPGYLAYDCLGCDGPIYPINIYTQLRSEFPQLEINTVKDMAMWAHESDKELTISEESLNGQNIVAVRGTMGGLVDYTKYEEIWYATDKTVVRVGFGLWNGAPAGTEDGWKTVKASLDFSKIE